jgi:hypothetical protein
MVTILPPKTSLGGEVGQSLKQGLTEGFSRGNELGFQRTLREDQANFQRNLLSKALNEVKSIHNNKDSTPLEKQLSYIQALSLVPERTGAEALRLLQLQAQGQTGLPKPGQPGLPGTTDVENAVGTQAVSNAPGQKQLDFPLPQPAEKLGEGFENIVPGVGVMPNKYSADQYRDITQQYLAKGLDPSFAIDQMQLSDKVADQRFSDIERAAERQAGFSAGFRNQVPGKDENYYNVAERISLNPKYKNIKNDKIRSDLVKKETDLVEKAISNVKTASDRIAFDSKEHERQVDKLKGYAKTYIDNGLRGELEADLAESGWGPVERERIINDLPQEVKTGFKSLPKFKDIDAQIGVLPDDPKYDDQAKAAFQNRQRQVESYKNYISDKFKTGSYEVGNVVNPGTSLLLLRDESMKNGMTYQEFEDAISSLKKEGRIQLDKYQQSEEPLLREHPAKSLGIGEILMNLIPFYIKRQ